MCFTTSGFFYLQLEEIARTEFILNGFLVDPWTHTTQYRD